MKVPYFRAKDKDSETIVEGFYFAYPKTTYCVDDYERYPVEIVHCLCFDQMTDWGLPNRPMVCTIDKNTLELTGYVDTDAETYSPSWLNRYKNNQDIEQEGK